MLSMTFCCYVFILTLKLIISRLGLQGFIVDLVMDFVSNAKDKVGRAIGFRVSADNDIIIQKEWSKMA